MEHDSITGTERELDKKLLFHECENLLLEIERLEMNRQLQDDRVQNVKHLVITDIRVIAYVDYLTMEKSRYTPWLISKTVRP